MGHGSFKNIAFYTVIRSFVAAAALASTSHWVAKFVVAYELAKLAPARQLHDDLDYASATNFKQKWSANAGLRYAF